MSGAGEDAGNSNGVPATPPDGSGVLANLPRTRPQRSSARRDAARRTRLEAERAGPGDAPGPARKAASKSAAAPKAKSDAAAAATKAGLDRRARPRPDRPDTRTAKRAARIRIVEEPVPKQGFECEDERATGSVQPPGGTELIATAAEMISEVAKAGVATGERLLRDMISLLPRS